MSLLPEFIPAAFPLLALSHFVALVSPGPDFFLLAGYAIRYRLRGSAGIGPGIALGNAFYIVVAMCGWRLLQDYGLLFRLIEIAGALYLIWIGGHLLRSRKQVLALNATRMDCPSWRKQFLLGLGSALLNPKNALFYLALMTWNPGRERHICAANLFRRMDEPGGAGMESCHRDIDRIIRHTDTSHSLGAYY